jgi:hypothetical protein
MAKPKKPLPEGVKVAFEAVMGRKRGRGIFGIEDEGDEVARQAKLQRMAERIASYEGGYEGNRRRCPQCGQWQQYKGEATREIVVEGGTLTIARAYYVCPHCHTATYPLDEELGLGAEQEQGRLREKLALVGVLVPYHQAPPVCQTLLGSERYASSLRRVTVREAERLTSSEHRHTLRKRDQDRIYLQIDGQLCPTREPRQGPEDQGYREAKAVVAFSQADVAEVSKERHEILAKVLKAQLTDSETFRPLVAEVYQQARGPQAAEVVVLADGAHWIWNLVQDLLPHAIQILDFSHAKQYLWEAAKLIYGADSAFVRPWVKEREDLLFADQIAQVITHLHRFVDLAPGLVPIIHYFQQNQARMLYGTYRQRGYFIGSGAIESVGKQLTAGRIKGPGMRWNVADLNALLALRCVFLEHSWSAYWDAQAQLAA